MRTAATPEQAETEVGNGIDSAACDPSDKVEGFAAKSEGCVANSFDFASTATGVVLGWHGERRGC